MKTVSMREQDVVRAWWIIDAEDKTLGRIATEVASRLRGKHKPEFTPHVDTGDFIVIVNAEKVRVTGNKEQGKLYWRHSVTPVAFAARQLKRCVQITPNACWKSRLKACCLRIPWGVRCFVSSKFMLGLTILMRLSNLRFWSFR